MYRYFFILIDDAERMERARKVRYFGGRYLQQVIILSNMVGLLFIRAYERAERVYQSMVSRGFDGDINTIQSFMLSTQDFIFGVVFLGGLLTFRFLRLS